MEALDLLNMEMSMDDLKFQEKLVTSVQGHYDHCVKMNKGILKAQCFYHISSLLQDLEHGSRWIAGPQISIMNKVKFGTLYNIASTLIAHISLIANENIKQFKQHHVFDHKMSEFTKVLGTIHRMLNEFGNSVVHFRMDSITPPIVCEIFERFWKEFTGMCETRWRRSIDDDEKLPALLEDDVTTSNNNINEKNEDNKERRSSSGDSNNSDSDENESDMEALAEQFQAKEEDPILYVADKIGNSCEIGPKRCKKYRVQIIDNVKREVIFQSYKYAEFTQRGEAMGDLAKKAHVIRNEAVKKAGHEVEKFSNQTYILNQDMILDTLNLIIHHQQDPDTVAM